MNLSFMLFIAMTSQSTGQVYDFLTEKCCGGVVHNVSYDKWFKRLKCCGTSVYDTKTSFCCDGKDLELPANLTDPRYLGCCGGIMYNQRETSCCKDKLYSASEKICNPVEGTLFDIADNEYLGFCHGIAYNYSYQQCSNHDRNMEYNNASICDRNHTNWWARGCCGNTAYDTSKELCCIHTIHPLYKYPWKSARNQCCGSNIYPLQLDDDTYPYIGKLTCCGDVVTEKSSITEECCGSIRYNTTVSLCCEGVLHENVPFGHNCCGKTSYNTESSWCCNGNVYPLGFSVQVCYYNMEDPKGRENYLFERFGQDIWSSDKYTYY